MFSSGDLSLLLWPKCCAKPDRSTCLHCFILWVVINSRTIFFPIRLTLFEHISILLSDVGKSTRHRTMNNPFFIHQKCIGLSSSLLHIQVRHQGAAISTLWPEKSQTEIIISIDKIQMIFFPP